MLIENIESEMERRIGEDRHAEHAPDAGELGRARGDPQRRHRKAQREQPDRPEAA